MIDTPTTLSAREALRTIRRIAGQTQNIVVLRHAVERQLQRGITRRQIELCVIHGHIIEGPFRNMHGSWQVTMYRETSGEALTCVAVIDWPSKILVITTY